MRIDHDVVVVGAGLAGLYAARLLAEKGWSVALIDQKKDLAKRVHTTGIFVRKTFEDFRFPPGCLGPALSDVRVFSPRGRVLNLTSRHDEFRVGRMARLYQELLTRAVKAGADWIPATRFMGIHDQTSRQRLILKQDGRLLHHDCRFVVGADGARSRVAAVLGLHRNHRFLTGLERVFPGDPAAHPQPGLYCYIDPELAPGYLAWVVVDAYERHVGVAGLAGRFKPLPALERFMERIGPTYGFTSKAALETRGGLIPVGGIGARLGSRQGLLIGDATGAVSPLTAGGLDPCLRLTGYACDVVDGFLTTGSPMMIKAYEGRRFRSRFAKRLVLRHVMDRMTSSWLCELGFGLLSLPVFRPLAKQIFFRRGSFPDPGAVPLPEMSRDPAS